MKNAKNNILFMAAADANKAHLMNQQAREIEAHLRVGEHRDEFEFTPKLGVRVGDLQSVLLQALKKDHLNIVHLSAEGTEDGKIVLDDGAGNPDTVSVWALGGLFKIMESRIYAIILDGSHTQQLSRQLEGSFERIISINGSIDRHIAAAFYNSFYQGLSFSRDVKFAFNLGTNQIQLNIKDDANAKAEASKLVLYERKVVVAAKPPLEKKSVKYLDRTRKICAASSV